MSVCSIHTKSVQSFFLSEGTKTAALYLNIVEEFLVSVLKERGPNQVLFQQEGEEHLGVFSLHVAISWVESLHGSGVAEATLLF
jgi:hypothetical protein